MARRGAQIIDARGASSAASAANAAVEHLRDWAMGTPEDGWTSMAVCSDGSYGIPEGLVCSFPVRCADGAHQIVQGLDMDDFGEQMLAVTRAELEQERDTMSKIL